MSSRNLRFVATLCALAGAIGPAAPAFVHGEEAPADYVPCDASGWTTKSNAEIRAGPSADAPLLATVSPRAKREGSVEIIGPLPEFEIHGYRDGWFLISGTSYGDYDGDPQPEVPLYSGNGWMRGEDISGEVLPGGFRPEPSLDSPSRAYGTYSDSVVVTRVLACKGYWVKVETDVGSGWVAGLCGSQVTTCS